jgi:hypothetical protein
MGQPVQVITGLITGEAERISVMSSKDALIRQAAFKRLHALEQVFSDAIPASELLKGFEFLGKKVAFKSQSGIFKPKEMEDVAALSITSLPSSPYNDQEKEDEWLYAYRAGSVDQYDNRLLRGAMENQSPVIFFLWVADNP